MTYAERWACVVLGGGLLTVAARIAWIVGVAPLLAGVSVLVLGALALVLLVGGLVGER